MSGWQIRPWGAVLSYFLVGFLGTDIEMAAEIDFPDPMRVFPGSAYEVENNGRDLAIADLNGDGFPDIVTVSLDYSAATPQDISVLRGRSFGGFRPAMKFSAGGYGTSIDLGDLDGDGILDLVVANYEPTGRVSVLLGVGDGSFQPVESEEAGSYAAAVAVGHLDDNAFLDVAVAAEGSDAVLLLFDFGAGNRSLDAMPVGQEPGSLAIDDVDADGVNDLVVSNAGSDDVSLFLGLEGGGFLPEQRFQVGMRPASTVVADLDGDGAMEIVTVNRSSDDISILVGLGDGGFQPEIRLQAGQAPIAAVAEDLDRDGLPDLAVLNQGDETISVWVNALGSGPTYHEYPTGYAPFGIASGDCNRDGLPDLAVVYDAFDDRYDQVAVLTGDGDGTFNALVRHPVAPDPGGLPRTQEWAFDGLSVGDFDGDGIPDIAASNGVTNRLSVLQGSGGGNFLQNQTVPMSRPPLGLASISLPPSVVDTLVFTNWSVPGRIRVLTGLADRDPMEWQVAWEQYPTNLAVGDVDGDGAQDLAVAATGISMLLGDGSGNLLFADRLYPRSMFDSVALGDLDGDGLQDVVGASLGSLYRFRNLGNGVFQNPSSSAEADKFLVPGGRQVSIATGDFDGDGVDDVVATSNRTEPHEVTVVLGWSERFTYRVGREASGVAVADLDGDGNLDIAVAHYLSRDLSVLLGRGDGSFLPEQRYMIGRRLRALEIADLNRDRSPDLVMATEDAMVITLLNLLEFPVVLEVEGNCTDALTLRGRNASPGGTVAVIAGATAGPFVLPGGDCAGTEVGIENPVLVGRPTADRFGRFSLEVGGDPRLCGKFLQAGDERACTPGNVVDVP